MNTTKSNNGTDPILTGQDNIEKDKKKVLAAFFGGLISSSTFIIVSHLMAGSFIGTTDFITSVFFLLVSGLYFGYQLGIAIFTSEGWTVFGLTSGLISSLPIYIFVIYLVDYQIDTSFRLYALVFSASLASMLLIVYGVLEEGQHEKAKKAIDILSREFAKLGFFVNFGSLYVFPLWGAFLEGTFTVELGLVTLFFFGFVSVVYLFPIAITTEKSPETGKYFNDLRIGFRNASLVAIPYSAFILLLIMQVLAVILFVDAERNWISLLITIIIFAILLWIFTKGNGNNE